MFDWVKGDPYKPNLRGFNLVTQNLVAGPPAGAGSRAGDGGRGPMAERQGPGVAPTPMPQVVPAVVGLPAATAEKILVARQYKVKFYPGGPTATKALVGKVQAQQFPAGEKLPAGQVVGLKYWVAAPELRQASATAPR